MKNYSSGDHAGQSRVMVLAEDAELVSKIHRILKTGKNVEIKKDKEGRPKVFKVSKEIEQ